MRDDVDFVFHARHREETRTRGNIAAKLAQIEDHWSPRLLARVNDTDVRIAKIKGEFVGITMRPRTNSSSSSRGGCSCSSATARNG